MWKWYNINPFPHGRKPFPHEQIFCIMSPDNLHTYFYPISLLMVLLGNELLLWYYRCLNFINWLIIQIYQSIVWNLVHFIWSLLADHSWTSGLPGHTGFWHFWQVCPYELFQKMVLISFKHRKNISNFPKLQGCGAKNEPAVSISILK